VDDQIYRIRAVALADVARYIDAFDGTRRHSHLGGFSPEAFEATQKTRRRGVH
jgi:putative transposase